MSRLSGIVLAAVLIAGGVAWGAGIAHRDYDYDEVQRAHSIWMSSQGLGPYVDFFECHPPYFPLLTPVLRSLDEPGPILLALRLTATAGNVLFLLALAALAGVAAGDGPGRRVAGLFGTAAVAFHPAVLNFLVEFRVDGWGYALALFSLVRFLRSAGRWRHAELGLASGIATLLLCPKLALLPPLVVAAEQARFFRPRSAARAAASYAAGLAAAGAVVASYLAWNGIGIARTLFFVARYNSLSNLHSGFHHGLITKVLESPLLALPLAAGASAWVALRVRTRTLPGAYDGAVACWLVLQAVLVSYPYKQYHAPWLLLASGLLGFLWPALEALPGRARAAALVGIGLLSVSCSAATARQWAVTKGAHDEEELMRFIARVASPDDRIVVKPGCHPIVRRDTFYLWFNTLDPGGYDSERILEDSPEFSGLVSDERYRQELDAHPPALVLLNSPAVSVFYPARQSKALEGFVNARGYRVMAYRGVPFAVRPDRIDRFTSAAGGS